MTQGTTPPARDLPEQHFFKTSTAAELWQRYCGFLELTLPEFMEIQRFLLVEQLRLLSTTPLGAKFIRGQIPDSLEAFRRSVPITTYADYQPLIGEQQEGPLPTKPYFWCHSAGRGGAFKWIPYTKAAFDRVARYAVGVMMLSSAEHKGDVHLTLGDRVLINLTPRPYASGSLLYHFAEYFPYTPIPSISESEELEFSIRMQRAFDQALSRGFDYVFSGSSVLVNIGRRFTDPDRRSGLPANPAALPRVALAWLRSKLARRRLLPRDLWSPKGIITFGIDTAVYEEELTRLWGKPPYQVYGNTEMLIIAMQAWNKKALTFVPDLALWEFIPESEWQRSSEDPTYQPTTVFLDGLEVGKQYELVFTHFHGMPLLRYRIGDVIKVVGLEDTESGVKLPQVIFQARANEVIDLAALTQIDERTLARAIANTGVNTDDWCARKEYHGEWGFLRIFVEANGTHAALELETSIEEQLRKLDVNYRDLEGWLDQHKAVSVTILTPGTFSRYVKEQVEAQAPLARLKPPKINPSEEIADRLVALSEGGAPHGPTS